MVLLSHLLSTLVPTDNASLEKTLTDLPEFYTDVQPAAVEVKRDCYVPKGCKAVNPLSDPIGEEMKSEYQWLDKIKELLAKDKLNKERYFSWSAHFASLQSQAPRSQAGAHLMEFPALLIS